MDITIHQTDQTIADFEAIYSYLVENIGKDSRGLHIFPELFLSGYPLQDLCLQHSFIEAYLELMSKIKSWFKKLDNTEVILLLGGLSYDLAKGNIPKSLENVIFELSHKNELKPLYSKRLLPNYDIFDEKKYFTPGNKAQTFEVEGKIFGLLICEDMWPSNIHSIDPVKELHEYISQNNIKLDAILNFSASPFYRGKHQKRLARAAHISNYFNCPFYYVNKVGGEDEILFDGQSFGINGEDVFLQLKRFMSDKIESHIPESGKYSKASLEEETLTWEELFSANLATESNPVSLAAMSEEGCQETLEALCFGVQEYAKKSGFQKFTIALSGGIDSALVLTLVRLSLKEGQQLEAIYMPSIHSSPLSHELSLQLCQKLGISLKSLPIKFLHSAGKNLFQQSFSEPFEGLTDENIQARIRGMLLYTRSNQLGSMVVNTSNKSELAVGYSTQYGDSVGAISLLGDLYKSEVFQLASYINKKFNELIPEEIITRPPTAELRPGQQDDQTLPPYPQLDGILEGILSYRHSKKDLLKLGFEQEHIDIALNLYRRNEYKRYQFCPIIKISSKSFGFGYRIPISKDSDFYMKS